MKTFRITDLVVQVILIAGGVGYGIKEIFSPGDNFVIFYFIVGAWQITSMLIHYFFATPTIYYGERSCYAKLSLYTLLLALLLGALSLIFSSLIVLLLVYCFALLWFTPLLAFYYLCICWKEYSLLSKKELIHLK